MSLLNTIHNFIIDTNNESFFIAMKDMFESTIKPTFDSNNYKIKLVKQYYNKAIIGILSFFGLIELLLLIFGNDFIKSLILILIVNYLLYSGIIKLKDGVKHMEKINKRIVFVGYIMKFLTAYNSKRNFYSGLCEFLENDFQTEDEKLQFLRAYLILHFQH